MTTFTPRSARWTIAALAIVAVLVVALMVPEPAKVVTSVLSAVFVDLGSPKPIW